MIWGSYGLDWLVTMFRVPLRFLNLAFCTSSLISIGFGGAVVPAFFVVCPLVVPAGRMIPGFEVVLVSAPPVTSPLASVSALASVPLPAVAAVVAPLLPSGFCGSL